MILLVEDNEDDVFIMERVMMKFPDKHKIHVAGHGRAAVDYLEGLGKYADRAAFPLPKLILLDLKMPVMNGFEVLAWIKLQPHLKDIPVAILTSSAESQDRQKTGQLGAQTFLVKPPTREVLSQLFQKFLGPNN